MITNENDAIFSDELNHASIIVLNLCSNNYLGLANDQRIKDAAIKAIQRWGVGPGAVRSIAGTMAIDVYKRQVEMETCMSVKILRF